MGHDFKKPIAVERGSLRGMMREAQRAPASAGELPSDQPLVAVMLDDEMTTAVLLSAPNAIGVCKLVRNGRGFERHVNRLEARNDHARALLANHDAVVTVASAFVEKMEEIPVVQLTRAATPPPSGIPLRAIEDVYDHLRARYAENEQRFARAGSRGRRRAHDEKMRLAALLAYAKQWRSEGRRAANAIEAGLGEGNHDNPLAIIAALERAMMRVAVEHRKANPDKLLFTHDENRAMTLARDYLRRHHVVKDNDA